MQSIMPPTSLGAIIARADSFGDDLFDALDELVSKPTSTEPSDRDIEKVAAEAEVSEDELRYFLSFLTFLYVQTEDTRENELQPQLSEFLREHGDLKDTERLTAQLKRLLSHRDAQIVAAKKARLSQGFLPNLVKASSFVDIRSDFERSKDGKLTGNVSTSIPVIQLALHTNSSRDFERDIVLQLDEKGMETIQEALNEINEKLKILSKKNG